MPEIILTEEQTRAVLSATEPVVVRDPTGRTVASFTPFSAEDIEMIERAKRSRAAGGPRIPWERVQAMLQKFHELEREGRMDEAAKEEILRRVKAGEPL